MPQYLVGFRVEALIEESQLLQWSWCENKRNFTLIIGNVKTLVKEENLLITDYLCNSISLLLGHLHQCSVCNPAR
jgi:hypothetical protein